jgi:hypothetical protein
MGHMRSPGQSLLWGQLMNFGHVPLFAMVASCVLGLCLGLLGDGLPRHRVYVVALAWSFVLAGASEAVQVLGSRNVEVLDFLRNGIGAAGALAVWASVDRHVELGAAWPRWRTWLPLLALATVLSTLVPVAMMAESYRRMDGRFPVLFRFDSMLELPFVREYDASLELVRAPEAWDGYAGRRVGRATFRPARYPTLAISELRGEWEAYRFLEWDLFLEGDRGIDVILRIDDLDTGGCYKDRFNVKIPLRPGPNRLRVSLDEVREAPEQREMDMAAIRSIMLFVVRPETPVLLYLADLRLVDRGQGVPGAEGARVP